MNINYYMCWDTVVILKPVEKYKATYFYHQWPNIDILLKFSYLFLSYIG